MKVITLSFHIYAIFCQVDKRIYSFVYAIHALKNKFTIKCTSVLKHTVKVTKSAYSLALALLRCLNVHSHYVYAQTMDDISNRHDVTRHYSDPIRSVSHFFSLTCPVKNTYLV